VGLIAYDEYLLTVFVSFVESVGHMSGLARGCQLVSIVVACKWLTHYDQPFLRSLIQIGEVSCRPTPIWEIRAWFIGQTCRSGTDEHALLLDKDDNETQR
jgi:hypothetical protein